jgi:aminopeptidase
MFEKFLDQYAAVAVQYGVALRKGEGLLIRASIEARDFVRLVVEKAYAAGALYVDVQFSDDVHALTRYKHAHPESFEYFAQFKADGMATALKEGYSLMTILSPDPDLLKEAPQDLMAKEQRLSAVGMAEVMKMVMTAKIKRTVVALPTHAWAKVVFPELEEQEALAKLWEVVFKIVRADQPDPFEAWNCHDETLKKYVNFLNQKNFEKLHFKGPGTDLEIGLAHEHLWVGGSKVFPNGDRYFANIPTEEVFTTPNRLKVNGTVKSTKPLSVRGQIVDDFVMTFKEGRVETFSAKKGEDVLTAILDQDEGARYLGEVALVPHSSPISASGLVFANTLFDENASCHLAVGNAYAYAMKDGQSLSKDVLEERGSNTSLVHVDFMIGSAEMEIIGIGFDGEEITLFRQGEWTF